MCAVWRIPACYDAVTGMTLYNIDDLYANLYCNVYSIFQLSQRFLIQKPEFVNVPGKLFEGWLFVILDVCLIGASWHDILYVCFDWSIPVWLYACFDWSSLAWLYVCVFWLGHPGLIVCMCVLIWASLLNCLYVWFFWSIMAQLFVCAFWLEHPGSIVCMCILIGEFWLDCLYVCFD